MLVKYAEVLSLLISSIVGTHPSSVWLPCPLRIIVMGSPFSPVEDQVLGVSLTVEPKRIELPHLPSKILSPSKGKRGCISPRSIKVFPKNISVDWSVTLLTLPAWVWI